MLNTKRPQKNNEYPKMIFVIVNCQLSCPLAVKRQQIFLERQLELCLEHPSLVYIWKTCHQQPCMKIEKISMSHCLSQSNSLNLVSSETRHDLGRSNKP